MLIVSKFHDYYDTAIAYGIDKECVYTRTTKDISKKKYNYEDTTKYKNKDHKFELTPYTIGFAGIIYRCIKVIQKNNYNILDEQTHVFYTTDSLIEYMKKHNIGLSKKKFRWNRWSRNNWQSEAEVKHYFNKEIKQSLYSIFKEHHVPAFVKDYNTTVINPCLKDFKFGKIKDAATAFQEIHQYLAGVLGNIEKETIDISDKTRIQQHGFDKWSFRTMPDDSKKNKKLKKRKD